MANRKELDPNRGPGAAFGARLRKEREARGWTQDELSDQMAYSAVHISAVETDRKPPTLRFAKSADRAFGLELTVDAFEREWRSSGRGALLDGFPGYVGYESQAVEIRLYEIGVVPGLLQTPEYTQALADSAARRGGITHEQAAERVAYLSSRQEALADATMLVVMDESCIRRPVGGPDVMADQLERLIEFAGRPTTVLQIAPYDIGERRPFNLPITLATLPDRSVVCYAESQLRGHLDREPELALATLADYHQLQAESLSQAESVAMIKKFRKGVQ